MRAALNQHHCEYLEKMSTHEEHTPLSVPDFGQVDPSILGISNPEFSQSQSNPDLDNLYPSQWSNKTWGQQLIFHTGTAYIIGTFAGVSLGMYEGINHARELSNNALRMNAIINKVSRRGSAAGNAFGVVAIMYTGYGSLISAYSYKPEPWHHITAAGLAGLTFKITAGPRAGIVAGALGAGIASLYSFSRGERLF